LRRSQRAARLVVPENCVRQNANDSLEPDLSRRARRKYRGLNIEGVTDQVRPFLATHESVWILYGSNLAQVMLEKSSPACSQIVRIFAQQLGPRWRAGELSAQDISKALSPTLWSWVWIVVLSVILLIFLLLMFGPHISLAPRYC
jgi:hypothetical protein